MKKQSETVAEPSAFERLVKTVVSLPPEEVAKLKKADRERKRRHKAKPGERKTA